MSIPHLIVATRNRHKVQEFRHLLGDLATVEGLENHPGSPEPEETGSSFEDNARIKAHALATWLGRPTPPPGRESGCVWVMADDSGLEVDALHGAPGIHSARFAALDTGCPGNSPDSANNEKLIRKLAGIAAAQRSARFRCVLALVRPDGATEDRVFEGCCEGWICEAASGTAGFGYDPLFRPAGHSVTFAELGENIKNQISHRAQATARLRDWLRSTHRL